VRPVGQTPGPSQAGRGRLAAVLLALAGAAAAAAGQSRGAGSGHAAGVTFTDVAASAGLHFTHINGASPDKHLVETMGSGGLLFDFDADGNLDVFLVDGGSLVDAQTAARASHRLFRNRGDGTFEDVTARAGIRHRDYGMGACAGDVDGDGWVDLYITNLGPNILYRNNGNGTFTDVTHQAGVGLALWSTSCAFLDADRDGDLDLFVTNYLQADRTINPYCGDPQRRVRVYCHPLNYKPLPNVFYRNSGKGIFTDASEQTGVAALRGNGLGVAIGDYDDDHWPDVFVANDAVPNFLFRNDAGRRFVEVALPAGVAVARDGKARAGMGTEFADYSGDGHLDLVVTNHEFETHSLFRNEGRGLFTDATVESGIGPATLPYVGFGVAFFDYDHDSALDLAIVNGHVVDNTALVRPGSSHAQRKLLLRQVAPRRFAEVGRSAGSGFERNGVGRSLAAGDIDNDGDVDLLVTNNGGAVELLRNDGAGGASLVLRLIGTKSNRDALGARVRLEVASRAQVREVKSGASYLGQHDLRLHVGLGSAVRVDRLEICWPSGAVETLTGVAANQIVTIREGAGIVDRRPFRRAGGRSSPQLVSGEATAARPAG
jgi:hypothetical protein